MIGLICFFGMFWYAVKFIRQISVSNSIDVESLITLIFFALIETIR